MPNRFGVKAGRLARARGSVAAVAIAALCFAQDTGPRIFRPTDQSVVPGGPLSIVARTTGKAELRLDGKPVDATYPGPGALTATVNPAPGRHELVLADPAGEQKLHFFVKGPGAPQGWKEFRPHPPAAPGCDTCHAVKQDVWAFRGDALATSCFGCHDTKKFAEPHSHNSETLAECQMCHSPHGSTEARHLKMRKELACKQCHG